MQTWHVCMYVVYVKPALFHTSAWSALHPQGWASPQLSAVQSGCRPRPGLRDEGCYLKNKSQRQCYPDQCLFPAVAIFTHNLPVCFLNVTVPALRSPPVRPVSACSSILLGGIFVPKAVWMLSTKFLQWELSTQILSPRESSMYTWNDILGWERDHTWLKWRKGHLGEILTLTKISGQFSSSS